MSLGRTFINYLGLLMAYVRLNTKFQLEYRGAFISQVAAMVLNDAVWLSFWCLFFSRFPVVHGWGAKDVVILWAICASGFGIACSIFGNSLQLPLMISRGQLDVWMLYPRALLSHILIGKMHAPALGDALFGYAVYVIFVRPDAAHFLMFVLMTLSVAMLFVGFNVATACLGFYLGNTEALTEQWRFALVTFGTYPAALFEGPVKLLLFTLIPAAFVSYLPVEALRNLSIPDAALAIAGSLAITLLSVLIFYHGLRRYESGNTMTMRG